MVVITRSDCVCENVVVVVVVFCFFIVCFFTLKNLNRIRRSIVSLIKTNCQ